MKRPLVITLVAALAALTALGLTAAGQTADTDLALDSLDPGDPAAEARRAIAATVHNAGDSPVVDFRVTFYWQDTGSPINGSEQASTATYDGAPLSSGEHAEVTFDWKPTEDHAGGGHLVALVQHDEDTNPDNDQGEAATFVTLPGVHVDPSWGEDPITVDPGEPTSLAFHVTNEGNRNATMEATIAEPEDRDWRFELSPTASRLLPGEQARFVLTVEPPAGAPAGQAANETNGLGLEVVQEGYEDSTLGHETPIVPDLQVAAQRELAANASEPDPREPGETLSATLTVTNEGNRDEEVTLERSLTGDEETSGWNVSFGRKTLSLPAGDSAETTVEIELASNATAGTHPLEVVAIGEEGANPPVARAEIPVEVRQVHRLDADAQDASLELLPDQPGSVQLLVTNTGNGPDNVTIDAEAPSETWTVQPSPASLELAPDETATIELEIRPPARHDAETGIAVPVRATAADEATEAGDEVTVNVTQGAYLHLEDVPESLKARPDSGASANAVLVNGGNEASNGTISVDAPDGWEASTNVAEVTDLAPGGQVSLRLTVGPPEGATPGEEAAIELEARTPGGPNVPETTLVRVGGPDWSIAMDGVQDEVPAGTEVTLPVQVSSQGLDEAPATEIELTAVGAPGQRTLATWTVDALEPGETQELSTTWNTSHWAGEVRLAAIVDGDDEIAEEAEANNEAEARADVTFVDLAVHAPSPRLVDANRTLEVGGGDPIRVVNDGNRPADVTLTVRDEAGWVDHTEDLTVAADGATPVELAFQVPRPTGTLANNVTVSLATDGATAAEDTWTLTVRDPAPPEVTGLDAQPQPRWGQTSNVSLAWDDATGLAGGHVLVQPEEGASEEIEVHVHEDEAWFTWMPQSVGPHDVVPVLEDRAGNGVPGLPRTVDVAPPPEANLTLGTDLPLAPGDLVPIETDEVPIEELVLRRDGVNRTLSEPYRVDTAGWSEGEHEVELFAEDALGRSTQTTLTIEIDATPPELVELRMSPQQPSAGDEVAVVLVFDEPTASAALTLSAGEGAPERVETEPVSDTEREATFTAPSGEAAVVNVEATDRAGNEAFVSSAAELQGPSGIPAPGAVGLLVATAVAAVIRRRR